MNRSNNHSVMSKIESLSVKITENKISIDNNKKFLDTLKIKTNRLKYEENIYKNLFKESKHIVHRFHLTETSKKLDCSISKKIDKLRSSYNRMTDCLTLLNNKCEAYDSISHLIMCNSNTGSMEDAEDGLESQCLGSSLPSHLNLYGRVLKHFKWIGIDKNRCTDLDRLDDVRKRFEQAWKGWSNKNDDNMNMFIEVLIDGLQKEIKDKIVKETIRSFDCIFAQLEQLAIEKETERDYPYVLYPYKLHSDGSRHIVH